MEDLYIQRPQVLHRPLRRRPLPRLRRAPRRRPPPRRPRRRRGGAGGRPQRGLARGRHGGHGGAPEAGQKNLGKSLENGKTMGILWEIYGENMKIWEFYGKTRMICSRNMGRSMGKQEKMGQFLGNLW